MSQILRINKILCCFTRKAIGNYSSNIKGNSFYICQKFSIAALPKPETNLEKHMRRLDQDVKRIGRISRKDIEQVLEEIKMKRSVSTSQSLLLIRCCGNLVPEEPLESRTSLVQKIWNTLTCLQIPMDISHYNALLRVYLENEYPFSPTNFLTELESKNIEPNRVTYQRILSHYCQQGDIKGATQILELMREKDFAVNENVFNSLILGHSQANDLNSAREVLNIMKNGNVEPSADTYTTLMCCYAKHGKIDEILNIFSICDKKDILLLDKDLLEIVYQLSLHGHDSYVDCILEKIQFMTGFNQDAVNVILRLVNKGLESVGLKILRIMPRSTRADGKLVDAGSFLIKQMVKINRPMENIISVCKTLENEGLNSKALLVAAETGLKNGNSKNTIEIFKEMQKSGLPIRQHYFWPLICLGESNVVTDVLKCMQAEFSIIPTSETVREYVIPHLKEETFLKIVSILRDSGITNAIATSSTVYYALSLGHLEDAAAIMETSKAYYAHQLLRQPLIIAFDKTRNYTAFIRIVRQIYESLKMRRSVQTDEKFEDEVANNGNFEDKNAANFVGMLLFDCCNYFRDQVECIEKLMSSFVEEGLSIKNDNAEKISDCLGSNMTAKMSEYLGQLSSGELIPVPIKNNVSHKRTPETMTVEELERFIANVEAKGENSNNLKRHLIIASCRAKNLDKTLNIVQKLENENYTIPNGVWAQIIDMYIDHSKLDEAIILYKQIMNKNSKFALDNFKTLRFVQLFLKENRFDEAIEWLKSNQNDKNEVEGNMSYNYIMTIWRILNSFAENGDAEKLQIIFDTLIQENYMKPNNIILGPLIKVHLQQDEITKAVEVFEEICKKYKCTPWKNEIACRLIQKEDAANLQKLTDLSTNIHGEVNSLYDLVFSFIECGRIRQARKILETPGLRHRPNRIENACDRYESEGSIESLEGLLEATRDLNHIDRNKIYNSLLHCYCKNNNAPKALNLWTTMQEENITPTDFFLVKLANLLQMNHLNVPFVISGPGNESTGTSNTELHTVDTINKEKKKINNASDIVLFRKALNSGNLDVAIQLKNQIISNEEINVIDISNLIEQLVQNGRLQEATKCVNELIKKDTHPLPRVFKYFLNKIAGSGDTETLEMMAKKINNEIKKLVSFDNRLCHSYVIAGKAKEYLKKLLTEVNEAASEEEIGKLAEKFPRGGALGMLDKHPELVQDYANLAEKYAEKNQLGPMNVLWMHYITHGDENASKIIWQKYLSNTSRLMFQRVLQTAREQKDHKLAELVVTQLRQSKISEGAVGNAYSCLIDIYTARGNSDEALNTLRTALKDVCLENINRTALQRLKAALNEKDIQFPFSIPEKKASGEPSSSSSSSSDDDVTPKRPETRP